MKRQAVLSIAFGLAAAMTFAGIWPLFAAPLLIVAVPLVLLTISRVATGSTLRRALVGLAVLGVALGLGLVAGFAAILVLNAMLPAFRPEDDETLRELIPAALAYATMAGTAALVAFAAWRRLHSETRMAESHADAVFAAGSDGQASRDIGRR